MITGNGGLVLEGENLGALQLSVEKSGVELVRVLLGLDSVGVAVLLGQTVAGKVNVHDGTVRDESAR